MNRIVQRNGAAPPWVELQTGAYPVNLIPQVNALTSFQSLNPQSHLFGIPYKLRGRDAPYACSRCLDLHLRSLR